MEYLSNGIIEIGVSPTGAELQSLKKVKAEHEYMWQGDARFWDRQAPILFPIVGKVWNNEFQVNGKKYPMNQHGFARDLPFTLVERKRLSLTFRLCSNNETLSLFPYPFELEITYALQRNTLTQTWRVRNTGNEELCFQIGGHPGFNYPAYREGDKLHGFLSFNETDTLISSHVEEHGYMDGTTFDVPLDNGMLPLTNHTFDCDTILDCRGTVNRVTLHDKDQHPYLTMQFHTPVIAIWSPQGGNAPFICIEPWDGCCDSVNYDREFCGRAFMNRVAPGDVFESGFTLIVE